MITKICSKCKEEKQLCEFTRDKRRHDGVTGVCLSCAAKHRKYYNQQNKEKISKNRSIKYYENPKKEKDRLKIYYKKNSEIIKSKVKKYNVENKEKISEKSKLYYEKNKEKIREYKKKWSELNKEKRNEKERERKKNPIVKLKHIVRCRILVYFKNKGYKKNTKTFDLVGCTANELKKHIENLFTDGMCWEKMGKEIHIDHIIPLSSAKTEEELYKLCHYSNLQPLWAKDNLTKSNKIL